MISSEDLNPLVNSLEITCTATNSVKGRSKVDKSVEYD